MSPDRRLEEVLDEVVFRLALLEAAVTTNTERLELLVTDQSNLDSDLQNLGTLVGQLVGAYQTASAKATAGGVDLSAEDAQVRQLAAQITGALPAPAGPGPGAPAGAPASAASSPAAPTAAAPDTAPTGLTGTTATKPLYTYVGAAAAAIDNTVWIPAPVQTQEATPRALYTFSGDTAGGAPTGQSADWSPYTGPTQPTAA
jgi:hypothetical protein